VYSSILTVRGGERKEKHRDEGLREEKPRETIYSWHKGVRG